MPRSGVNGTYTLPGAQKTQQPLTPIPSAVNNQGWEDVEQTFNTIQPIAYGGTGGGTILDAQQNLGITDKLNKDGSNVGDEVAQAAFRVAIGALGDSQAVRKDVDQSGSYSAPEKVTILKNTLQAWEQIGVPIRGDGGAGVAYIEWTDLGDFRTLRLTGKISAVNNSGQIFARVGSGGVDSGGSDYINQIIAGYSTTIGTEQAITSGFVLTAGGFPLGTYQGLNFHALFTQFNKADYTAIEAAGHYFDGGNRVQNSTGGVRNNSAGAHDTLRLISTAGNVNWYDLTLEGIRG